MHTQTLARPARRTPQFSLPARRHALTHAVHWALAASAVSGLAATAPMAYAQEAQRSFDVPAGPLDQALRIAASQAGVALVFTHEQTAGRQSAALRGSHTTDAAFAALLAGSGWQAVRHANGGWALRRVETAAPAAAGMGGAASTLSTVTVTAHAERSGTTEGSGSYAATGPSSTATRLGLALRDTPQSVSVVTREQMDDRGLQSLDEVARDATGVTMRQYCGECTEFSARGFVISTFLADGVPLTYDYETESVATMAMYDRVEFLRGAAGLMVGTGNPSGTINLVRKRPTATPQVSITGSLGSWADWRGELDAAGPLNAAGTLRGRTVVALHDSDSFKRAYGMERQLVYGTLEADIAPGTLLSVGGYLNREDNPGGDWQGLPLQRDGSFYAFDRSTRVTPDWAYRNRRAASAFAELEHRLDNGWTAQATARFLRSSMDVQATALNELADPALFSQYASAFSYEKRQYSLDLLVKGPWQLLGRTHELVFGASLRRNGDNHHGGAAVDYQQTVDPLNWDAGAVARPVFEDSWSLKGYQRQHSVYGAVRLRPSEPLALILGARIDSYRDARNSGSSTWRNSTAFSVINEFTPYAGAVYTLDANHSVYASWASVFQPQNTQSATGALLDPVTGTNTEAGVKGEYLGGRLTASAAVFQVNQTNLPLELPLARCATGLASCYAPAGEVRARGLEFEVAGELAAGWQVASGYTMYTARHVKDSSEAAAGTPYGTDTPRHLLKLSTRWRLPGAWQRWSLGGALHTRSDTHTAYKARQGGYTTVDLMAAWQMDEHLDFRLNINNVFDKTYYQAIGGTTWGNYFGAPRNAMLTARYRF